MDFLFSILQDAFFGGLAGIGFAILFTGLFVRAYILRKKMKIKYNTNVNNKCMNKTKIWSVLVMLLFTTPFFAQNNERKKVDGVAAVVGDYLILESDIDKAYIDLQQQDVDTREINRCQMLGKLMEDKLYAHQAVQDSVKLTDSEVRDQVNQRIEFLTAQLGGDIKKLLQFYKKDDEQSMRDELFNLLKVSMLAQRMKQQIIKDWNSFQSFIM